MAFINYSTDEELNEMDILEKVFLRKITLLLEFWRNREHTSDETHLFSRQLNFKKCKYAGCYKHGKNHSYSLCVLGGARVFNVWVKGKFEWGVLNFGG